MVRAKLTLLKCSCLSECQRCKCCGLHMCCDKKDQILSQTTCSKCFNWFMNTIETLLPIELV